MQKIANRYWVVGGLYRDAAFEALVPGTERVVGPFHEETEARHAWRILAEQSRSACLARFSITVEPQL